MTPAEETADADAIRRAMRDLTSHPQFWTGTATNGHISATWNGLPAAEDNEHRDPRGAFWERATFASALYTHYRANEDWEAGEMLVSDWKIVKASFRVDEFRECGRQARQNWASDDAGWAALWYLQVYDISSDQEALDHAIALCRNAYARWYDDELGGGLWYGDENDENPDDDSHRKKSLYESALTLAELKLDCITGNSEHRYRAQKSYCSMEKMLLRKDGLYWCERNADGPMGSYDQIAMTSSSTFLGGNMAMGVLHALMYRRTGELEFLERAKDTASAIASSKLVDKGVYINDRDAWTNAMFVNEWREQVLTLPGIDPVHESILRATALSIVEKARTSSGFYGGCWSGPPDGEGCAWSKKEKPSLPSQIMTSSNAVNMVVAGLSKPSHQDQDR